MTSTRPQHGASQKPRLAQLGAVFARYANMTFGGGSATIAVLHEQIVERRAWISESEFELSYGLSRLTPGTNLLAFCTAVGWTTRRWAGSVVSLVAASLPCSAIAVLVTHFYEILETNVVFRAGLRGALAAAVAIMINTAWVLAKPYATTARLKAAVIFAAALLLVRGVRLAPFHVLLISAVVGVAWPSRTEAK